MSQQDNNLVDNILNTQKNVLDNMVESTKKMTGGNSIINESMQKGADWYKNWLETQKTFFSKATEKATEATETVKETVKEKVAEATETAKETASKIKEFNENWYNTQVNFAKQMWEASQDWSKSFVPGQKTQHTTANPFAGWQENMNNMNNNWSAWMNNMQAANWMAQAQQMNPLNTDSWKKANDTWTGIFGQYTKLMNNNFGSWQQNFENHTAQDAYKNMSNMAEGFAKFAELWEPMLKFMQDKSFNMDTYKQYANPDVYKEMLDKYFGFMPAGVSDYYKQMSDMTGSGWKQAGDAGFNGYQQFRNFMNNPAWQNTQGFGNTLNAYNNWWSMMNETAAPLNKMITPNQYTKAANEWADIANRTMVYHVKNAELQYMVYHQGQKVLDALAENTAKNMKEGKEVTSILSLYQEWLNISDKVYVSLFESPAYSKLMTEVNSMQMKLQKDIELQMESMMGNMPVAKRSELDGVYKQIYDLKKQVKDLERELAANGNKETAKEAVKETVAAAEEKTTKSTKKA